MKRKYILILLLLSTLGLSAQRQWTLQECIDYAVENNISVQNSQLNVRSAENDLNSSQNSLLPSAGGHVNSNFGHGYSQVLGRDSIARYVTSNTGSLGFSVSVDQVVFQGFSIKNAIAANRLKLDAAIADFESAKESISLGVVSLFLQAMFAQELVSVAQSQLELSQSQYVKGKALVEGGKSPESALYEAEALVARDEMNLVEAQNSHNIALLDIAQLLNLDRESGRNFEIRTPELGAELLISKLADMDGIYEKAIETRPAIAAQQLRLQASGKEIDRARSGYYPSVSLSAGIGTGYDHVFGERNIAFGKQLDRRLNEYVGLGVSIPIFNRFTTRNNVREAVIAQNRQALSLLEAQQTMRKEIEQAHNRAVNAHQKYRSAEASAHSTRVVMEYEVKKYEAGLSTLFNFNDAKNAYIQSQSELLKAKYEYIFSSKVLDYYADKPLAF